MTLSWDPDDGAGRDRGLPLLEAAVVSPDQVDEDFEEPEPDELLLVRLQRRGRTLVRASAPSRSSRPGGRAVPSAAARSTPRATSASVPTGSSAATRDRAGARRTASWSSTAGSCPPPTPPSWRDRRRTRRLQAGGGGAARSGTSPTARWRTASVAAYVVSEALGWDVVPPTFLREGPHGRGMVQLWREPDPQQEAVTVVPEGAVPARLPPRLRRPRPARPADLPGPRGLGAAAPDGGLRRAGQQRRPQGRARPGDARRPPVRRRPRRLLPPRPQAAHGALGLGGRAARPTTSSPASTGCWRRSAAPVGEELAELLDDVELMRLRHRGERLRGTAVVPASRGVTGRPSRGRRSEGPGYPSRMRAWTAPELPDLDVAGPTVRLHDTASGAPRRRHPATTDRPGSTSAASRRTTPPTSATPRPTSASTCCCRAWRDGRARRDLRPERHRRRRPAARARRQGRRRLARAGRARDRAVPAGHGGAARRPARPLRRRGRVDPAGRRPGPAARRAPARSTASTTTSTSP